MIAPFTKSAVLEILRTPAASDTFPDMIRRVEALEGCGSSPPFHFDRYINGVLMAEGVTIERQSNMSSAMQEAARIASRGPSGEAPVLVYFGAALEPVAQPETPTNTSGVKGVHWCKRNKKWQAQIKDNGKSKYLGLFARIEDAGAAYATASAEIHGAFGRTR